MSDALQQLIEQAENQKVQVKIALQFKKNLALFEKHVPDLYNLMVNHVPSKVILRLDPNRELNLVDIQHRHYIYNEPPKGFCQKQMAEFSQKQSVQRFRLRGGTEYNPRHIHLKHLNALIRGYQKMAKPAIKPNAEFMPNLIVSGVGLGYHLPELIRHYDIRNCFIHEACIDSFHASMHTIDWQEIFDYFHQQGRSITFCIGKEPSRALTDIEFSIQTTGLHAQIYSFIYTHSQRAQETAFVERYLTDIQAYIGGLGYYDDEQIGLAHGFHNLQASTPVFVSNTTQHRQSRLLLIGNGPSLDDHQQYIERNKDNAIIMSCGSALGSLLKMGIKPDFHVEMERTDQITDFLMLSTDKNIRKDITLLCLHTVSPRVIAAFGEACYAIKPNDAGAQLIHDYFNPQKINELGFCNPTVTNCGLAFAVSMGFSDIHLIGVDLGIPTKGEHHSKNSFHYQMEKQHEDGTPFIYAYSDKNSLYHCGNFGGSIKTHTTLNNSRLAIERLLRMVKLAFPNVCCVNSNNGAKIEFTKTVRLADIEDCKDFGKEREISHIKYAHFYENKNHSFGSRSPHFLLKGFFGLKDKLKIHADISNDVCLVNELQRIYSEIEKNKDPTTHFLMRGSINCFFGLIIENCLYCADLQQFRERVAHGATEYNAFIDAVYARMEDNPFRVDDTQDPILRKMQNV